MNGYRIVNNLLKLGRPSVICDIPTYAIGWRILDNHDDSWTKRFDGFKGDYRSESSVRGCIEILREASDQVLSDVGVNPKDVTVVSALSSSDKVLNPSSALYRAGNNLCEENQMLWNPDLLQKGVHAPLHTSSGAAERESIIQGQYKCCGSLETSNVMILDDFITRGTTISEITRAILEQHPNAHVFSLAIAKHERLSFDATISNRHIPARWVKFFS